MNMGHNRVVRRRFRWVSIDKRGKICAIYGGK